jgi:hypothetical protein
MRQISSAELSIRTPILSNQLRDSWATFPALSQALADGGSSRITCAADTLIHMAEGCLK